MMVSKRTALGLLIGVLAVKICSSQTDYDRIDSLVQDEFMEHNRIPGVGLAIVEDAGDLVYAKGYGYADLERNITADENTKFCIASITKTFTATLIMKVLSEKFPELGAAVLDTPLRILHPDGNFTFSDRFRYESMSFRDLLSHRHGLRTEMFGSAAGAFKDIEEFTFRSRYAPEVASFRAGGFYSNTLVALAGKLIAEIAEQPYDSLLQNFFDQLGMNDSTLITADMNFDTMANMSRGYFLRNVEITQLTSSLINRVFVGAPSGGIISSSSDMAKYIAFHLNNGRVGNQQIVPEEAMMWMRQSAAPLDFMQFRTGNSTMVAGAYAMSSGFQLGVFDGWQFLTHTGQWTTFMSEIRIYPDARLGIFSINNGPSHLSSGQFGHFLLQNSIFEIIKGLSPQKKMEPVNQNSNKKFGDVTLLKNITASEAINSESFVGIFGNPVEGEVEITQLPNGTLYFSFGIWATGFMIEHPTLPQTFTAEWNSDFVQDIYFGAGGLVDVYMQFETVNELRVIFDDVYVFRRGVTLDTLPIIPWDPQSCGPTTEPEDSNGSAIAMYRVATGVLITSLVAALLL